VWTRDINHGYLYSLLVVYKLDGGERSVADDSILTRVERVTKMDGAIATTTVCLDPLGWCIDRTKLPLLGSAGRPVEGISGLELMFAVDLAQAMSWSWKRGDFATLKCKRMLSGKDAM
jgi:hypothetical protein